MDPRKTSLDPLNRVPQYPLRIFSVKAGTEYHVRTLSEQIFGLFTHWKPAVKGSAGGSKYCWGARCPDGMHRTERIWKGYIAAEWYDRPSKLWKPVCLEVTEYCELDMRHLYCRGQVWFLRRPKSKRMEREPLRATLEETLKPYQVSPDFDIFPCLVGVYHSPEIDIRQKNPLPDRVMVEPVQGDPPQAIADQDAQREADRQGLATGYTPLTERARILAAQKAAQNGNGKV